MIAFAEAEVARSASRVYVLKVVLSGVTPEVWRRIEVPARANFGWLHAVLQLAMGWGHRHLHQFEFDGKICTDPTFEPSWEAGAAPLNEWKTSLDVVARRVGATIRYTYDFGDDWRHEITVEKIHAPGTAPVTLARCLEGARACPPENCGGPPGYESLLRTLKQSKTKGAAPGFRGDPEAFDLDETNAMLALLRWPRVTVPALAKIIRARARH